MAVKPNAVDIPQMMEEMAVTSVVGMAAFAGGLLFGAVVQRTHFCTMGAIADLVLFQDWRRMRAWLLAMGIAILGSQILDFFGHVELSGSLYRASDVLWLGALLGGGLFGFGMTLTGGCGSRNVVRFGAGNLKSLVVLLVMGVVGYMTMNGLLALPRLQLEAIGGIASTDQGLVSGLGLGGSAALALSMIIAVPLLVFCFKDKKFRKSPRDMAAGLVLGSLIPFGWLVTGMLGADDFEPVPLASFSFVAPVSRGLIYLMTFPSATISFGIAAVGGVLLGAFIAARLSGDFRIEGFAGLDDLVRHLIGAAMMGIGGVLGLGCTIGQGMTGLSTLAAGSFLTVGAIIVGGIFGVRYLEQGSLTAAARTMMPGLGAERSGG